MTNPALTPAEHAAYELHIRGMSQHAIALALNLGRRTVRDRLASAYRKLEEDLSTSPAPTKAPPPSVATEHTVKSKSDTRSKKNASTTAPTKVSQDSEAGEAPWPWQNPSGEKPPSPPPTETAPSSSAASST